MKLLLLTRAPEGFGRAQITNFSGVWSYYLPLELRRRGIGVRFAHLPDEAACQAVDLTDIDHIVALGNRPFDRLPRHCEILKSRCRGAVTQTNDKPIVGVVDCTFTVRDDQGMARNHHVGWAADAELLQPAQDASELRVLIDHPDYVAGRGSDRTAWMFDQVARLVRSGHWHPRFASIRVRCIVDDGFEDCDYRLHPFHRRHVSYEAACQEYVQAHLFMVTHRESVGLTALEVATAGGLPVGPAGFIAPDRLATMRHYVCRSETIDWPTVLAVIDIPASRAVASANSWGRVAERMLDWFVK